MVKKHPRKESKQLKTTNIGLKILKHPRVHEATDKLFLSGESAENIARLLKQDYNFEVSGQTVRAYLSKVFAVSSAQDEAKLKEVILQMLQRKTVARQGYIKETVTMASFLIEVMTKLNEEIKVVSDIQALGASPGNALALGTLLKLLIEIRARIDEHLRNDVNSTAIRYDLVNRIFVEFVTFLRKEVFALVPKDKHEELKTKIKQMLKKLQSDLGVVEKPDYKIT